MKKIHYILISLTAFFFWGCEDYLDKPDSDDITVDMAFETVISARKVLNDCYADMNGPAYNISTRQVPYDMACDNGIGGYNALWTDRVQNGSWNPDDGGGDGNEGNIPTVGFWSNTYQRIRRTNLFLENIDRAQGDKAEKMQMVAQARFLRAFYYEELIRRFGGVIILDHSVSANDYTELTNQPRNTFEESVEWACKEFTEAAAVLPPVATATNVGHATSAACYAAIARLRLTAASPLFNTDSPVLSDYTNIQYYGNYDKGRWKLAADACRVLMTSPEYTAYYGLHEYINNTLDPTSWEYYYRGYIDRWFTVGKEAIWISYPNDEWEGVRVCWNNRQSNGWNWVNPSYSLAMEYEMYPTGLMPSDPKSDFDQANSLNGKDRDPRFMATIQAPNAKYDAYGFEPWQGGRASDPASQRTGFCMQKYIDPLYVDNGQTPRNQCRKNILRIFGFDEVLLNFAEAENEYSGPTPEVYKAINDLRARVGMPALPTGLNQDQMRQKIWHERRVELAFEDFRFFDIRRWRIGEEVMNGKYIQGYDVTKPKDGGFYTVVNVTAQPMVFLKQHYLLPMGTSQILMNPALQQNPGWPKLATATN